MNPQSPSAPITVRIPKTMVDAIDALTSVMDRSRNYLVNQALQQYLEANAWQVERIQAGIKDAQAGRVKSADVVLTDIAVKRGWRI